MERDKILTIKHFLNKRLKPKVDKKGSKYYTPYVQITYNRYNTQFIFNWAHYISTEPYINRFTETEFKNFEKKDSWVQDKREVDGIITKAIKYEEQKYKSKFSLKGFGKRLSFYFECFTCEFQKKVRSALDDVLRDELTTKQYDKVWDKLDFASIIETIEYIERKYVSDIKTKISDDIWVRIQAYYLFISYTEKNDDADQYYTWLFDETEKDFEVYVNNKGYQSKNNAFRREFDDLPPMRSFRDYKAVLDDFISKEIKKMEVTHLE